jgi:alkylation response protein AidB-like acyl-CoA dehydrogenase
MDLQFSREDKVFREEAREWLNSNSPNERRPHAGQAMREFDLTWQKRQYEGGWAGVSWPKEYGGLGLSLTRQLIWNEEYARADAPDNHLCFVALNHAGPTIIARGSEAQSGSICEASSAARPSGAKASPNPTPDRISEA